MSMFLYKEGFKLKNKVDLKTIKMIIWDLDEILWNGTLFGKNVHFSNDRISLIVRLSKRGIINSICSKNEYCDAMRILEERGLKDFLFLHQLIENQKDGEFKSYK